MLSIDRSSHVPVFVQLVNHFRGEIAAARIRTGESLPSTRAVARQLGISFHTVRKAYGILETEGLVRAHAGTGYLVSERHVLSKADRIEQGAAVIQEALTHLIALGLSEQEIEYVIQEQLEFFEPSSGNRKIVVVAEFVEFARAAARQIESVVQESVEAATPREFELHQDSDLVFAELSVFRAAALALEGADVQPIFMHFALDGLAAIARMHPHETLGLVVLLPDSVAPLLRTIKPATGFGGQIVAVSLDEPLSRLQTFVRQVDLVAYLPDCRRRIRPLLEVKRQVELQPLVSPSSLAEIRDRNQP